MVVGNSERNDIIDDGWGRARLLSGDIVTEDGLDQLEEAETQELQTSADLTDQQAPALFTGPQGEASVSPSQSVSPGPGSTPSPRPSPR